jgi:hypothetical protein
MAALIVVLIIERQLSDLDDVESRDGGELHQRPGHLSLKDSCEDAYEHRDTFVAISFSFCGRLPTAAHSSMRSAY